MKLICIKGRGVVLLWALILSVMMSACVKVDYSVSDVENEISVEYDDAESHIGLSMAQEQETSYLFPKIALSSGDESSRWEYSLDESSIYEFEDSDPPKTELPDISNKDVQDVWIIGTVCVPAVGLSDALAVGTSYEHAQKVLETSASILCYEYKGLPGESDVSVVGGHNYMEFNKLKNAQVGDEVWLYLDTGDYGYVITEILIQDYLASAKRGTLVLYTCYPFDEKSNPTGNAYFLCAPL